MGEGKPHVMMIPPPPLSYQESGWKNGWGKGRRRVCLWQQQLEKERAGRKERGHYQKKRGSGCRGGQKGIFIALGTPYSSPSPPREKEERFFRRGESGEKELPFFNRSIMCFDAAAERKPLRILPTLR